MARYKVGLSTIGKKQFSDRDFLHTPCLFISGFQIWDSFLKFSVWFGGEVGGLWRCGVLTCVNFSYGVGCVNVVLNCAVLRR